MTTTVLVGCGFIQQASATTNYIPIGTCPIYNQPSVEAQAQVIWRDSGTLSSLHVLMTQSPTGAGTLNVRIGGVNGNGTLSLTGSTDITDNTHTDSVSSGNLVNYQMIGGSGTNLRCQIISISYASSTSGNSLNKLVATGSVADTSLNTTYYNNLCDELAKNTVEAQAQFKNKTTGTLQNLYIYISANTASIATLVSRVATANGNQTISIGSGSTAGFEDTTHTDSIVSGNLIDTAFKSTVTTSITFVLISMDFITTNNSLHYITANPLDNFTPSSGLVYFLCIAGGDYSEEVSSGTDTGIAFKYPVAASFSGLEVYVRSNSLSSSISPTFRISGASGNQTVTYGSAVTGYLDDTTHTDSISANATLSYTFTWTGTGTMSFSFVGVLATYPTPITVDKFAYFESVSTGRIDPKAFIEDFVNQQSDRSIRLENKAAQQVDYNDLFEFNSRSKTDGTFLIEELSSRTVDARIRLETISNQSIDKNLFLEYFSNQKIDSYAITESLPCWQMQQNTQAGFTQSPSGRTLQFTNNVKTGAFLVIVVGLESSSTAPTVTVSDDQNGVWTQAGTYTTSASRSCSIFYFVNSVGGVRPIVTVTPSLSSYMGLALNEFSVSSSASSVVFDHGSNQTNSGSTASTGTCTVSGSSELVIAGASQGANIITAPTVALPFIIGAVQPNGQADEAAASAYDPNASVSEACTFTYGGAANALALAASFKIQTVFAVIINAIMTNESIVNQKIDSRISSESTGTAQQNSNVFSELTSIGKSEISSPLEALIAVAIDGMRLESNQVVRIDKNAPAESISKSQIDANLPLDVANFLTVQVDGALNNEWMAQQRKDIVASAEFVGGVRNDADITCEFINKTTSNVLAGLESITNYLNNCNLPIEALIGVAVITSDYSLQFEWRTNYVSNTGLPAESRLNFNISPGSVIDPAFTGQIIETENVKIIIVPKEKDDVIDPQNQGRIFTLKVTQRNL